jgi:hypothetical protein
MTGDWEAIRQLLHELEFFTKGPLLLYESKPCVSDTTNQACKSPVFPHAVEYGVDPQLTRQLRGLLLKRFFQAASRRSLRLFISDEAGQNGDTYLLNSGLIST